MATASPLLTQTAPPFVMGQARRGRSASPGSRRGNSDLALSSFACVPPSYPAFAQPPSLFPPSCASLSSFFPFSPQHASPPSSCQLRSLVRSDSRESGAPEPGKEGKGALLSPLSRTFSASEGASAELPCEMTTRASTAKEIDAEFFAEIERFVEAEEEGHTEEVEGAGAPELWRPRIREMQSFPWAAGNSLTWDRQKLKPERERREGTVLLPRFAAPPLSCFPPSRSPLCSAFKDTSSGEPETDGDPHTERLCLAVFTIDQSHSRSSLPPRICSACSPSSSPSSSPSDCPLQDLPFPFPDSSELPSPAVSPARADPSSSRPSLRPLSPPGATRRALAVCGEVAHAVGSKEDEEESSKEDEEESSKDTFITSSVFFKEQRFFSSISWAMFFLGVGVFLPWNCLVMEMATFDVAYFPTFPWTEAATQVRTACFFLGQLLLLWLGPRLQLIQRTVSTLIFSSLTTVALAMVAAWIPENPAFHICCVLSGIIGVQGSLLHASVYVLHAVIHHELAVDWSIGGGLAGPLTALLAFPLYFLLPASKQGQRLGTLALFSFSALWSLLAAGAVCLGARHPLASAALLRQEAEVRRKQEEGLSRSLSWSSASGHIARLSRSLSWFGSERENGRDGASEASSPGDRSARPVDGKGHRARERWQETENKDLTVGEVAAEVEKAAIAGEETPYILGSGRAQVPEPREKLGEDAPLLALGMPPSVSEEENVRDSDEHRVAASQKALFGASWRRRDVFWAIRANLVTCFLLFLSTYLVYPVKTEHLLPSSSLDFVLFQMILVACFQAGNVLGRLCVFWGCRAGFAWLLPLVLLRLFLIPLFFFLDGSLVLPSSWFSSHLASPAAAAVAETDMPSQASAFMIPPPESAALGPSPGAFLSPATSEAAASGRHFSQLLSANQALLTDASLFLLMMLFATLHGWLSVLGAFYATQVPPSTPQKETAAYLMCVAESCGVAVGVALSVLWASLAGEHPLSPHKASAHAVRGLSRLGSAGEGSLASLHGAAGAETLGATAAGWYAAGGTGAATGAAALGPHVDTERSIGLQRVPKLG